MKSRLSPFEAEQRMNELLGEPVEVVEAKKAAELREKKEKKAAEKAARQAARQAARPQTPDSPLGDQPITKKQRGLLRVQERQRSEFLQMARAQVLDKIVVLPGQGVPADRIS